MSEFSTAGCSAATQGDSYTTTIVYNHGVCNLGFILLFLSAVTTTSDIHELQQQIKQLMELIQKLATEFRAVKAELEESRVDVDSIHETLKDVLGANT